MTRLPAFHEAMASGSGSHDVTDLLHAWGQGDQPALDRLLPLVHAELHRVARRHMRRERPSHTLQPSGLVSEAYLRLLKLNRIRWQNRAHFFAVAAGLMRQVLVDYARARGYQKRGGGRRRITLDDLPSPAAGLDVLALDEALQALETLDHRKSRVVEMRFFAGMSVEEIALALGVSPATVMRDWKFAKVWLARRLRGSGAHGE